MEALEIKHGSLVEVFIERKKNLSHVIKYFSEMYDFDDKKISVFKNKLQKDFLPCFSRKWNNANRQRATFEKNNQHWLGSNFTLTFQEDGNITSRSDLPRGRPRKTFGDSSGRTKRRHSKRLITEEGEEQIKHAHISALRACKQNSKASIIEEVSSASPSKIRKVVKSISESKDEIPYTPDEALALIIDLQLTKNQYNQLRKQAKVRNCYIYPSYHRVSEAKARCHPPKVSITISPRSAKIKLQDILDHTAKRIFETQTFDEIRACLSHNLMLICKWGCDGSSGQNEYKQVFGDETEVNKAESDEMSDTNLFMISFVPICLKDTEGQTLLWENTRPSSTVYCRPIKFAFEKETKEKTVLEVQCIEREISELTPTIIEINNARFSVHHKMLLTMVDGKVCQALTDTPSASTCIVCLAKPSEMNDLQRVKMRKEKEDTYRLGLSTLHAWIRFMELVLHVGYNLEFRRWAAKTPEQKEMKKATKKRIQQEFRERLGLIIDQPRQGSGNSNDGNTARRFFHNPEITSQITGVNIELIQKFYIILQTLACGRSIDPEKFGNYAMKTAEFFVEHYNWYYMPASVHKILIHGKNVIKNMILPIGQLSEETQESRNKDYKKFRLNNTRKCSRVASNEDLLHRLLVSSDPFLATLRCLPQKNPVQLESEAETLLE